MELRIFLQLLKKQFKTIVLSGLICGVVALVIALKLPVSYTASHSVYVQKIPEQPAIGDYTYDGYYAQQAAELYTDTVVGLFESPAILSHALELNEAPNDAEAVKQFERNATITKVAPRIIDIRVKNSNEREATALVSSLFKAVNERVQSFAQQDEELQNMKINVVNIDPLIVRDEPSVVLFSIVGLLLGVGISMSVIVLREYLLST